MRWVADTERGQFYCSPVWENEWAGLGALTQNPALLARMREQLDPKGLAILHCRWNQFDSQTADTAFPWNQFLAYNAAEIAAGRSGLIITAGGQAVTTRLHRERVAVHIGDDRFINFFIEEYVQKHLDGWLGPDNGIVDRGWFTPSTGWDPPYPQNNQEYTDAATYFFDEVARRGIQMVVNIGMQALPERFQEIFKNVAGLNFEFWPEAFQPKAALYMRQAIQWGTDHPDGILMLNTRLPADEAQEARTLNAYLHYLIARNDNSFFGPQVAEIYREIPESAYAAARETLGWHTGAAVELAPDVYQREHEGGMVYLNVSAETGTIHVPAGYRDKQGEPVETLDLAPLTGDYVVGHPQGCSPLRMLYGNAS